MGEREAAGRGLVRAAALFAAVGLVAACATGPAPSPAPVFLRGDDPGITPGNPGSVAASYRSPAPVYLHGADGGLASGSAAAPYSAAAPAVAEVSLPARGPEQRIVERPVEAPRAVAHDSEASERERGAVADHRPPHGLEAGRHLPNPDAEHQRLAVAPAPRPASPPPMAARHGPDIVPLDRPAPAMQPARPPAALAAAPAAMEKPAAPSAADGPREQAAAPRGSRFPWPVNGHVVEPYGVTAGGARNDGINIAAPLGTSVRAVDGGVVAYAGNELRGYGNLVLIKHPDGWISAYAHCENLLVKRGDRVDRGQVIAKVGETGGVSQPQLHFELRRGKQAVDPRDFLSAAPSTTDSAAHRG